MTRPSDVWSRVRSAAQGSRARVPAPHAVADTAAGHDRLEILSAIPGRVRFRYGALSCAQVLGRQVDAALHGRPGIREVHVNVLTARILVRFDPELPTELIHQLVTDAIHAVMVPIDAAAPSCTEAGGAETSWRRELVAGATIAVVAAIPLGIAGGIALGVIAGGALKVARIVSSHARRIPSNEGGTGTSVLLQALRPHRRQLVNALVTVGGSVLAGFAKIFFLGTTIDTLVASRAPGVLAALGLGVTGSVIVQIALIVVATAAYGVLKHRAQTAWAVCSRQAQLEILLELCRRIEHVDLTYLQAHPASELVTALRGSVVALERAFDGLLVLAELCANTIVLTLAVVLVAPSIAWIALIPLGVMMWQAYTFYPRVQHDYEQAYASDEHVDRVLGELLDGITTIKNFNLEQQYLDRLRCVGETRVRSSTRAASTALAYPLRLEITTLLGISAVVVAGTLLLGSVSLSVGTHMALLMYAGHLFFPFAHLGQTIDSVQRGFAALRQLHQLEHLPREASGTQAVRMSPVRGGRNRIDNITFEHVSYSYPGAGQVLHDVNLQFRRGTITGIVGPTGSARARSRACSWVIIHPMRVSSRSTVSRFRASRNRRFVTTLRWSTRMASCSTARCTTTSQPAGAMHNQRTSCMPRGSRWLTTSFKTCRADITPRSAVMARGCPAGSASG